MWMRVLLTEMEIQLETPTIIYVDNQSAIKISENDSAHETHCDQTLLHPRLHRRWICEDGMGT